VTETDRLFAEVCEGDEGAFAGWMGRVERPIRLSLRPYAHAADVESVVQETLMRMWRYALDRGSELEGENASLRFAIGMARNIARSDARRFKREVHLPPEELPEVPVPPEPVADPGLAKAIAECLAQLAGSPLKALRARLELAPIAPDRQIAQAVGMTLNTFLQNIVRARRHLARCLAGKNVRLQEYLS
jgi:DNA-directed RNA polymerase specialized sigma24 family protein